MSSPGVYTFDDIKIVCQPMDNYKKYVKKLKLNINHSNDEDLEEDFSYLNYLRQVVLYMMRKLEKSSAENQRADNVSEIADTRENDTREQELGYMLSAVRENEGR